VLRHYMEHGQNYVLYLYHKGMADRAASRYLAALIQSWEARREALENKHD